MRAQQKEKKKKSNSGERWNTWNDSTFKFGWCVDVECCCLFAVINCSSVTLS